MKDDTTKSTLPDAFKNFDELPDAAFVRIKTVQALFACAPATIWRRVRMGTLPAPYRVSPKVTTWKVGDLRKTLREAQSSAIGTDPGAMHARAAHAAKRALANADVEAA